jgi:hypothetical protein
MPRRRVVPKHPDFKVIVTLRICGGQGIAQALEAWPA